MGGTFVYKVLEAKNKFCFSILITYLPIYGITVSSVIPVSYQPRPRYSRDYQERPIDGIRLACQGCFASLIPTLADLRLDNAGTAMEYQLNSIHGI